VGLFPRLIRILPRKLTRKEIELQKQIDDLWAALTEIQAELARLSSPQEERLTQAQSVATLPAEDCNHWNLLLETHIRVIQVLELEQAKLGSEFHYSKLMDLQERRYRVSELQRMIQDNCPSEAPSDTTGL